MGKSKVPPGDAPEELRIEPDKVWYSLWYVPRFPLRILGGKLAKLDANGVSIDVVLPANALLGLKADIAREGQFRNPVIVWNHHSLRGKKQPYWLLRAGSNRVWCAEQLGWTHVPAVVSTATEYDARTLAQCATLFHVEPALLQTYFRDGGNVWANEHGFGLLRAKKPQETYRDYQPTAEELAAVKPTSHGLGKLINPLEDTIL